MTDAELLSRWYLILVIAGAVVAVAAVLLFVVWSTARGIERAAARGLGSVKKIVDNTAAIWELDKTNAVAWELREAARSIHEHAEEIARALQTPAGPRA